jgi:hypothetical protein
MTIPDTSHLPKPLDGDNYKLLRRGISDDPIINVYTNDNGDFAFLHPMQAVDYAAYIPRVHSLGLQAYKKTLDGLERRLKKISPVLSSVNSILEIGAADAAFLAMVHEQFPGLDCYSVEPDQNTRAARDAMPWLKQASNISEVIGAGTNTDIVAMFHVFEHLEETQEFLANVKRVLTPNGFMLIEVPSLTDPLLSLYASPAYQSFYFQRQHPFVFSPPSLERVLAANGFAVERFIPHQRYGMENHLQWLTSASPGGNQHFLELFSNIDEGYRLSLEQAGTTDSIIALAKVIE